MYGKLIDGKLIYPKGTKQIIKDGNWLVVEKTLQDLLNEGFKVVEFENVEEEEGFELIPHFEETAEKIYVTYAQQEIEGYWEQKAEAEEAQKQAELERIGKLKMTKYDFYKYIVKPYGLTYAQLEQMVSVNDEVKAAWDLCNHVFRGDTTLNAYIKTVIPTITDEALTEIFIEKGEYNG